MNSNIPMKAIRIYTCLIFALSIFFNSNSQTNWILDANSPYGEVLKTGGQVCIGDDASSAPYVNIDASAGLNLGGYWPHLTLISKPSSPTSGEADINFWGRTINYTLQYDDNGLKFRFYNGNYDPSFGYINNSSNVRDLLNLTSDGKIVIGEEGSTTNLNINGDINFTGNLYKNGVLFSGGGSGTSLWSSNGSHIYYNSGFVGIGTLNPTNLLDVRGSNQRISIGDGTNSLTFGQWDAVNNRIESGNRPLLITTYSGNINLGPSGTSAMSITSGSNIGIGNTAPSEKLEVNGNIKATKFIGDGSGLTGISASQWITSGSNVYYSTGNVGIGNTDPGTYKLNVTGDFNASSVHTGVGKIWAENNEFRSTGNGVDLRVGAESFINGVGAIGTVSNNPLVFVCSSGEKMRILTNGSIGIGTTSPQATLHVAGDLRVDGAIYHRGTLKSQEIKVEVPNGTWKDYVFSKTYKLKTLGEVEQYIQNNGHLPEIPSAKEVEQNGVSVGDMQAKLLQKVEELTLYVIELKKENDVMKKENEQIKQELVNIKNNK